MGEEGRAVGGAGVAAAAHYLALVRDVGDGDRLRDSVVELGPGEGREPAGLGAGAEELAGAVEGGEQMMA